MHNLKSLKRNNNFSMIRSKKLQKLEEDDDIHQDSSGDEQDEDEDIESNDLISNMLSSVLGTGNFRDNLDDNIKNRLKQIEDRIETNAPTIERILNSGLSDQDKQYTIQLFNILDSTPNNTLDYLYLQQKINNILSLAPNSLNSQAYSQYLSLNKKMEDSIPTIEKIVNAKLIEEDKLEALKLYKILQLCTIYTDYWFEVRNKINNIISKQFTTDDELSNISDLEHELKISTSSYYHTNLKITILSLNADNHIKKKLYDMYQEMMTYDSTSSKHTEIKEKLRWAVKLPYRTTIPTLLIDNNISLYCRNVYHVLNADLYGMKDVKEKVMQVVNDRIYNPNSRSLIALKGKPGVGKTKLAKTIAKAVNLPFDKINLGGAIDSTIFKGSDSVWSGSSPSLLLQIMMRVKCCNAVILLDEIDKLSTSSKGVEVQNSLLHILDPTQNDSFQDSYLNEFPHDISKVWFIPSLNDDSDLHPALRDRLNIINIPSYNHDDMIQIIKLHTLPDMLIDKGFEKDNVTITDEAAKLLLTLLGEEVKNSGMRIVERCISDIVSKINLVRSLYPESTVPLTFKLPKYEGLPYRIDCDTVNELCKDMRDSDIHQIMYV